MRDNLDLQELRERADYYKTSGRKRRNKAFIVTLGIFLVIGLLWVQFFSPPDGVYSRKDGEWVKQTLSSSPIEFQHAGQELWLYSASPNRMTRMDGEYRYYYDSSDFEECCPEFNGIFTTLRNVVFAVDGADMLFWDTNEWKLNKDWFPVDDVVDIAVSNYFRAITDSGNRIHIMDGSEEWKQISLPEISETVPQLHAVPDEDNDNIYLIQDGLWRYDNDSEWNYLQPLTSEARILGDADNELWLDDASVILKYDITANKLTKYPFDVIGIAPDTPIRHIFTDRRGTYLVTNDAIFRIDDDSWESMSAPENTVHGITGVGVIPNGAWLVASTDLELVAQGGGLLKFNPLIQFVLILTALFAPFLVIAYMWVIPHFGQKFERASRSKKILIALFPTLPEYQHLISDTKSLSRVVTSVFLSIVLFFITMIALIILGAFEIIQDDIPFLAYLSLFITLGVSLPIAFIAYWRKTNNITRQYHIRQIKGIVTVMLIVGGFLVVCVATVKFVLPSLVPDTLEVIPVVLYGILLFVGFSILVTIFKPSALFPSGLTDGSYELALESAAKQRKLINKNASYMLQHALVLSYSGRYEEAQDVWMEGLEETQNNISYTLVLFLVNLGYVAERLGNHQRAIQIYESSISILPESPIFYRLLVNFYQNQRIHLDRALELSEEMIARMPKRINRLVINRMEEGSIYATHALALANMDRFEEANTYIQKAYEVTDDKFIPTYSHLLRKAGLVKFAQGKIDEAIKLLNQATEIDPKGDTAKLVQSDLDYISKSPD